MEMEMEAAGWGAGGRVVVFKILAPTFILGRIEGFTIQGDRVCTHSLITHIHFHLHV